MYFEEYSGRQPLRVRIPIGKKITMGRRQFGQTDSRISRALLTCHATGDRDGTVFVTPVSCLRCREKQATLGSTGTSPYVL